MRPDNRPADLLVARLRRALVTGDRPLFVGVDGRSGAGKSTLAATVAQSGVDTGDGNEQVTVIDGDDFYSGGSAASWDRRSAAEKADVVIDWRRQRDVLDALRQHGVAEWHAFDWEAEDWDADTVPLAAVPTTVAVAPVVVLDGAYSCRPELHDLLDLRVLLELPDDLRHRRLVDREGADHQADWDARWAEAEDHYFGTVMPPECFDLVLREP